MENTNTETSKMLTIFAHKIRKWIDEHSFMDFLRLVTFHLMAISLTIFMVSPEWFIEIFTASMVYNSYMLPKYAFSFLFLYNWRSLIKWCVKIKLPKPTVNQYSLEGVPVTEILDHLFENQSFKHDDVVGENTTLKMSRKRFDKLAKKLEDLGVLVRGENRARILNKEYSRADIASMLEGKKKARDIQPLLRRVGNTLKASPSAKEIEEKVQDAAGFTVRAITGGKVQTA